MRHFYKPRHAAGYNARAARAATELADVYQPKHAAPEQPEHTPRHLEPIAVTYTGHGLTHGTYRPDVAL